MELVKISSVHRYSVDILASSGPSGILGSDREQNTTKARSVRIVALSISPHEQTQ